MPHPLTWQETPHPSFLKWIGAALVTALCATLTGRYLLSVSTSVFAENGYVENLQALILVFTSALFLQAYARSADAKALFCAIMAVASLLMLQREIPACESPFYESGVCVSREGKWFAFALFGLVGAGLAYAKRPRWQSFLNLRNLAWVWPVGLAVALLVSAEVAEHMIHQELEEMLELGAYGYLAVFAYWVGGTKQA